MTVVAILDANVLYPSTVRDVLLRVAIAGGFRAKWSDQILDEVFGNLTGDRPDLDPESLRRTRALMNDAVRDARVEGYEYLIEALELPDVNDRHVLAAAIASGAEAIVTFNLKDFPADALGQHGIIAVHPDAFLTQRCEEDALLVVSALRAIAAAGSER